MNISKYNIISGIRDSNDYFLINILSGNADILTENEVKAFMDGSMDQDQEYIQKGYVVDLEEEKKIFRQKYLDFLDNREKDEIQIFFVSTYSCNFKCTYCYQVGYNNTPAPLNKEVIDAFFEYLNIHFAGRKKYITLFGGEPLINSLSYKARVRYFMDQCIKYNLELSIVTNGYYLIEYLPLLIKTKIREIQVTLDGTAEVHNQRRFIQRGKDTFEKISEGIDALLEHNIPVNLRMVLDRENIYNLPEFADYAINKGWTKHPLFKTQLGRNYELYYCQSGNNLLFSRVELYEMLYKLINKYPQIMDFHKPSFSVAKFLFEHGKLPDPLFDACPGCKTEWAFDYSGGIYSCTATVGKKEEQLGTFYPNVWLDNERIEEWEQRDILAIKKCRDCQLQLACGGGCGSIAKNNYGNITSPDCRPVKELLEFGISFYRDYKVKNSD